MLLDVGIIAQITWEVSMPHPLVECVPNFSEGRRPEVVVAILESITAVEGAQVLDYHSDHDHNRTVITFVGPPQAVEEAAFRAIRKAAELIDLDQHTGEHPRMGATDVVPFVPISDFSMEDCVALARRLGQRVGEELNIPVYLYEAAATQPERKNLEDIRRGEYEGIKAEIGVKPEREPDFGPTQVGPAGATVIGARPFLIAYNVYLTTEDVSIARRIAKTVRHSSGGLRYVKALGLLVDGRAQVSMNLTDFRKTSLPVVVELIRRETARYGVAIHHSELVGLIPQDALVDAAVWYTQMDQFEPEQVLEKRLYQAMRGESPEAGKGDFSVDRGFLEALAAGTATPGGGSAAAYAAAAGAGLVAMVARLTLGKKKYADVEGAMQTVLERAETLREELTQAVTEDAQAFTGVMQAFRMPKDSPEEQEKRSAAIQEATLGAARVPLSVASKALEVLELAVQVVEQGNLNAISDGASAAALARAAMASAGLNVRTNVVSLDDSPEADDMIDKLRALESRAAESQERIRITLIERGGLPLG